MQTVDRVLRVLLRAEFDAAAYERSWRTGATPDRLPYGLENEPEGWRFEVARARFGSRLGVLAGKAIRRVTGFDLAHAWLNRRFLTSAEAVYCHSEVEYLGAAAVLLLTRNRSTCLLGQTIWLFHSYDTMPRWRRALLGRLLARVDVLVYNAEPNLEIGEALFPGQRHEYVPFGVSRVFAAPTAVKKTWDVVSVGNDVSRDWPVLEAALGDLGLRARVATGEKVLKHVQAQVGRTESLQELRELYAAARCVVIAVRPNSHAGGITSLLEAAASATAVIATRAGGLDSYFDDDAVRFVPAGSAEELREAITELIGDEDECAERGRRLRAQFDAADYSNAGYWKRVTDLLSTVRRERSEAA